MNDILIEFIYLDTEFRLKNEPVVSDWLLLCLEHLQVELGDIAYFFCSDEHLLQINIDALNHDYYTDIISFDYSSLPVISGEIFISVDRVKENANDFNVSFTQEMLRVLSHGICHFAGYKDKSQEDQHLMRSKEDECIDIYNRFFKYEL
jgi:probable rRNA maturation factor